MATNRPHPAPPNSPPHSPPAHNPWYVRFGYYALGLAIGLLLLGTFQMGRQRAMTQRDDAMRWELFPRAGPVDAADPAPTAPPPPPAAAPPAENDRPEAPGLSEPSGR